MKKNLFSACLMILAAILNVSANDTWPITLTKADGLPGVKGPKSSVFKSPNYSFDEPISTLRFTVVSTNTVDELQSNSYDGLSAGYGPGFPYFSLSELNVYDADGNKIEYAASSNTIAVNDGSIANINDGNIANYFHTTYAKGGLSQEYHYIDLEFTSPINNFSIEWYTRAGYEKNQPTYVGLTPGTQYLPYPEQSVTLGEQVTDVAQLAEGGIFLIKGNAPEFYHAAYERTYPGCGFWHSPYGAHAEVNAASAVYLIPQDGGLYKVAWLNNGHYIAEETSSEWCNWTNNEISAASIQFVPCDSVQGDFLMTFDNAQYIIGADAVGKMALSANSATAMSGRENPTAWNFTIYKAAVNTDKIKFVLEEVLNEAKTRIELYGGKNEAEDTGEYDALTEAVNEAEAVLNDANATAAQIIDSKNKIGQTLPAYAALRLFYYIDSINNIYEAIEDGIVEVSYAPNWVKGTYPEGCGVILTNAVDEANIAADNYTCLADIDAAIEEIKASIASFWASKISDVKTLPFRVGKEEDGLPGVHQSYGGFKWESPLYLLSEETTSLRMTVLNTNNGATYCGYVFPTLAEFELYDFEDNKINLTTDDFRTNSVRAQGDGAGIAGLCDGSLTSYYHGAYGAGQDPNGYENNPAYVYIEVQLPEPISAFRYVQYGRANAANTPIEFIFGKGDIDVTPDIVLYDDPYDAKLGEQITDPSQITDDGIYAIMGLYYCDPVNGEAGKSGRFFSSQSVLGNSIKAQGAYTLTSAGDGKYYIQSLADGKFWAASVDETGMSNSSTTLYKTQAAKVNIVRNNNDGLPNSMVIYQYDDEATSGKPYTIFQDWGSNVGNVAVASLSENEKDGEGEWYIYKMTMDTPYSYWLSNIVASAETLGLTQSQDPGCYRNLGSFPDALLEAQKAVASEDEALCKEVIAKINTALSGMENAQVNPVVEGTYIIESGYSAFYELQGVNKAIFTYPNDALDSYLTSEYKMYWGDAPTDPANTVDDYKFNFVSAAGSDALNDLLSGGLISEEEAASAFFIKNVAYDCYIGGQNALSRALGTTEEPEVVYVIRKQGAAIFDIWNPLGSGFSLHCEWNSSGTGKANDIVYWYGYEKPSYWKLRRIDVNTSINNLTIENNGDEVVSITYYSVSGVASSTPVKGINIVKTVYANGVVESKKIIVK